MREEFAEHEGVVGLGVVFREPDVLVHVECDDVFESDREGERSVNKWHRERRGGDRYDSR